MRTFDPGLFKPVCTSLIAAFSTEGHHLGRAHAHELVAAALGFWTYKLAREHSTPLTTRLVHRHDRREELPRHWAHLTKRIESVLGVSTWAAQALAPTVDRIVRDSGPAVDTQSLIFDSDHLATREEILKAIDDRDFEPNRASVAMARGLLPYPTRTTLGERLQEAASACYRELDSRPAYLWLNPSTRIREVGAAVRDSFSVLKDSPRAQMGFNLIIVIPDKDLRGLPHYTLVSPWMSYQEGSPGGWRSNYMKSVVTDAHQAALAEANLEEVIGHPVADLPKLEVCPQCAALHCPEHPALGHVCTGPVSTAAISNAIRDLQATGAAGATSDQIAKAMVSAGHAEPERRSLEQLIRRHRLTLWGEPSGGVWTFSPAADNCPVQSSWAQEL